MSDRNFRVEYTQHFGSVTQEFAVEAPEHSTAARVLAEMVEHIEGGEDGIDE